nr:MAG: replication associated protein [Cressdnaviricota sp.]
MTEPLGGIGGEGGNILSPLPRTATKQVPKRKKHFFTVNGYTEELLGVMLTFFNKHAKKYAFQEEVAPTTGKRHLQGGVIFEKEHRSTEWDKGQGCYAALKDDTLWYGLKDETRPPDGRQWTKGIPKPIKIIETLYPWQKDIEDIFLSEPDDRRIFWFWESKGNIGKSAFVKYMVVKHKCLFCDGGKKADLINLVFNNDMDECTCVIWDLPRSTKGSISYATLESIKNGMVCNTKYETGVKFFNAPHIFVFANYPPERPEELSEDRWVITEL